jgi:hypothetical protein
MDHSIDSGPASRLQDVSRPPDVGIDERLGRDIRIRDGDECREVKDNLDILCRRGDEPGIPNVA